MTFLESLVNQMCNKSFSREINTSLSSFFRKHISATIDELILSSANALQEIPNPNKCGPGKKVTGGFIVQRLVSETLCESLHGDSNNAPRSKVKKSHLKSRGR